MEPTTLFPFSMRVAILAVSALLAFGVQAQPAPLNGRVLFKQKNCSLCHFFEARSVAPSVKTMKRELKGDPAKTSAAISAAAGHAGELKSWSATEIRAMSEWLAGISFEEQAAAEATKPKPGSPEAKRQAAAKAKQEAKAAAEAKAQARRDAEAKAKAAAEATAQARKDATAKAKQEAEAKAQAGKDAAAKARQEAEAKAQATRDADAQAKREAAAKKEKEDLAKREAEAKARKDTTALDAIKRENEERARRDAEAKVKREAEERNRLEAEAKAKKDAEAQAAQKRDAEARAKKEAEAQAVKKPDTAAKAEPAAKTEPSAKAESPAPGGRKKIAYRDGSDLPPCPAPTGAPLGAVDEGSAKAIIERVGCPQCHAYVQKKTGPPMKNIQEKYKGDWECVTLRLTKNKTHKEEGVTDDLKPAEVKIVSDYIATRNK